jgi:threonine synthase
VGLARHRRLPAASGLFVEAASAVAVLGAYRLVVEGARQVVALGTGSGLKGLGGETSLPSPPDVRTLAEHCDTVFASSQSAA